MQNVRKRPPKETETMSHSEMLNEEEQQKLIDQFNSQDVYINKLYKIVLTLLSLSVSAYFGWLTSISSRQITPLICSFTALFGPLFVAITTQELIDDKGFIAMYGTLLFFSLTPVLIEGFGGGLWAIPGLLMIFDAMIIRDMLAVKKDLKKLESSKYTLKGA